MLWDQPFTAQENAPSIQRHSFVAAPASLSVLVWGGEAHDTELSPDVTYTLDVSALLPDLSLSPQPFLPLPRASVYVLGLGLVVLLGLLLDWALRAFHRRRSLNVVIPADMTADPTRTRLRSASFSRMLGALQGIIGSSALWLLAALAAGWATNVPLLGVSVERIWPAAVATGLVLSSIVLGIAMSVLHGAFYRSRDGKVVRKSMTRQFLSYN